MLKISRTESRKEIFEKYILYSEDLKKLLGGMPLKQWVNGSFVTKERNPKDIDLVTFVDHHIIKKQGSRINIFRAQGSWENYGVDAYIVESFPMKSKKHKITEFDSRDWLNLFTNNRPDNYGRQNKKGFLEIIY